jgi:hypothetical protein
MKDLIVNKTPIAIGISRANEGMASKSPLEQNQVLMMQHGGNNQGTCACKKLLTAYAEWLSPRVKDIVIKQNCVVTEQQKRY